MKIYREERNYGTRLKRKKEGTRRKEVKKEQERERKTESRKK